jgi:hypothetical protein
MDSALKTHPKLVTVFNIFSSKSALWLGVLFIIAGTQTPSLGSEGLSILLGTLAYRSAKNRVLGTTKPSILKVLLEWAAFILVFILVALKNDLKRVLVNDPFPNIFVPAWLVTAYLTVVFQEFFSGSRSTHIGRIIAVFIAIFFALFFFLYSL